MEQMELQRSAELMVNMGAGLVVRDQATRDEAMDYLRAVKQTQKRVEDYFGPLKKAAHDSWKGIVAKQKELLDPLGDAERMAKSAIVKYDTEQERDRQAERRRLQAEADERARREREAIERKAASMKTEAKREEYREAAEAVVAPVIEVAPAVQRQVGECARLVWRARLFCMEHLTGLPAGDLRLSFLSFDQAAANKFAVATKGAVKVPGVEFIAETVMALKAQRPA